MRILACILAALAFSAHAALTAPAGEIIGKSVLDPARADLGRVEDLIVDLREGRVHYAVLGWRLGGPVRQAVRHSHRGRGQRARTRTPQPRSGGRIGEPRGELRDFEVDLATGEIGSVLLALEGDARRSACCGCRRAARPSSSMYTRKTK